MPQVKLRTDGGADLQSALMVNTGIGAGLPDDFSSSQHSYLAYYRHTTNQDANSMSDGWHDVRANVANCATTTDNGTLIQNSYNGTPFQIWIPDDGNYVYKRHNNKTAGLTGVAWSKLSAGSADSVNWTGVVGRPTGVSDLTNDAGYLTSVPLASTSTTGIVKIGNNISVDSTGVISLTKANITSALGYTPPTTDTTYGSATTTYAGLVKIGNNISVNSGVISISASNVTSALGYAPPTTDTTYGPATTTYAGLVSTTAQSFAGKKTFQEIEVTGSIKASLTGATFEVDDLTTYSGSIRNAAWFLSPNMGTGAKNAVFFGKTGNTRNAAFIGFAYTGSGSTGNYLRLGHYDANDQMIVRADGNVGIATTSPGKKLDVNGSARATDFYVGSAGAYISYNTGSGAIEFNN